MKRLFILMLLFISMFSIVYSAEITLYNQSTDYTSVTNNNIYNFNGGVDGGWTTLDSTKFSFGGTGTNYNRGARFTITNTNLQAGEYLNISFDNYQTHDRWNHIGFYDSSNLGFAIERMTLSGIHEGVHIRDVNSAPYTGGWGLNDSDVKSSASIGVKDTSAIPYNLLFNGTHTKVTRNGVLIIDWTSIGKTLTNIERIDVFTQAYNSGIAEIQNLVIIKQGILVSNFTITDNIEDYYNTTNITIQMNTSVNSNMSYSLDGGSFVNISLNSNSSSFNIQNLSFEDENPKVGSRRLLGNDLTANRYCYETYGYNNSEYETVLNPAFFLDEWTGTSWIIISTVGVPYITNITCYGEGEHNISLKAVSGTTITYENSTFTIDLTNPTIDNNILPEYNSYTIDGFNSSCSDPNLASCNISLNSQNVLLNASSFNFTQNGNISYTITAVDLAGNTATESGVILVNPEQCFNFFLENGTAITNYDFGGSTFSSNPACFNTYNDVLVIGANSFNFEKLGYATTQINFTVNTTSNINNSYNITQSKITINIYDRETGARITDLVELAGISTIGFNTSTSTGQVNISDINFIAETYQVIASSTDYLTESVYFTYDNQIDITKDIYMVKSNSSNAGIITIKVKDELSNFIEGAVVSALEWKSSLSSFVNVAECQTNIGGSCDLNIELNTKAYKFSAVKDSVSKTTNSQIIATTETVQTITLGVLVLEEVSTLDNLLYSFNETLNNNISTTRLEWLDSNGIVGLACISVYKDYGYGQTLLKQNCTSASNGILYSNNNINNSYDLIIKGTISYDGVTYNLGEFRHFGEGNIAEILVDNNLHIFVPIVFAFLAIAIGIFFGNIYISLSLLILLECIAVAIVPSIITVSVAVVITVITSLIFWGVSKR